MAAPLSHLLVPIRTTIMVLGLLMFWLLTPLATMVLYDWIDFFTTRPHRLQLELLGEPPGHLSSLTSIRNDCCAINGDGGMQWTYSVPPATVRRLSLRCRPGPPPRGEGLLSPGASACVLRHIPDPVHEYDGFKRALLWNGKLIIEQSWS